MSLSEVAKIGTVRKLESGASRKTYSIQEMAEALGGYHGGVFYRWLRTSRFPQPDIPVTEKGRPPYKVYSAEATKALVKVFSDHQKVKAYFHKSDTDTIQKLFDVMGQKV